MAFFVKNVVRFSSDILLRPKNFSFIGCRQFVNPPVVGLDQYLETRSSCLERMGNKKDQFRNQMEEYMDPSINQVIFTEDLKAMIHVAETNADISTVLKMITRYHVERKHMVNYRQSFGCSVMRMFHFLKLPNQALDAFFNKELEGFFYQTPTVIVLCDLLFDAGQYEAVDRVIDVWWPIVQQRQSTSSYVSHDFVTLCMATFCKMNTAESYQKAKTFLNDLSQYRVNLKSLIYFALFALKQNQAETALETITRFNKESAKTLLSINLQLLTYLKLGRRREALQILADIVEDSPMKRSGYLFADVLAAVEKSLEECMDKELVRQFEVALASLKTSYCVRDHTLDQYLYRIFSNSKQSYVSRGHSRSNNHYSNLSINVPRVSQVRMHSLLNKEETLAL